MSVHPEISRAVRPPLALLALASMLAVACDKPPTAPPKPPATVDLGAACSKGAWIGILKQPDATSYPSTEVACPAPWQPLFATSTELAPGLRRFCICDGDCKAGRDPRLEVRRIEKGRVFYGTGKAAFESIEQDCPVVGPSAETFFPWQGFGDVLRDRFRQQAGQVGQTLTGPGNARLVVIDSVQDDATEPFVHSCPSHPDAGDHACSPHGWALTHMARDLLCPGGDCGAAVEITTRRALRWTYEIRDAGTPQDQQLPIVDPGAAAGGLFGYRYELAQALHREVDAWVAEGGGRPRLILNLSIGWEQIYGGSAAVRAALEEAACRGVLVMAAAGNRRAGSDLLKAPLFPAAWEALPAPSVAECTALLGEPPPPDFNSATAYRPLVHAAGGVQHDGRPLSNSRPGAAPRLAAFGDHASVLYEDGGEQRPETLTGTSVATLVVSAAAVKRWVENPALSAFDVADGLWQDGQTVSPLADFCQAGPFGCPDVRRVLVQPPPPGAVMPDWPGGQQPIAQADPPAINPLIQPSSFSELLFPAGCDPGVLAAVSQPPAGADLCPQQTPDVAAQPWLGSQPGSNHNPNCIYTQGSPGTLVLEFEPGFRIQGMPAELSDFTLIVDGKAYRLSEQAIELGDGGEPAQRILTDLPFENFDPDVHPMYLAVKANGEHGILTPLLQVFYE